MLDKAIKFFITLTCAIVGGAAFYSDLREKDLTYQFINAIEKAMSNEELGIRN